MLLLSFADFFINILLFEEFFQEQYQSVKLFGSMDILSVLIWVQTVCIGYQQMTKVAASNEKRNTTNVFICIYDVIQGYTLIFLHLFYYFFCQEIE